MGTLMGEAYPASGHKPIPCEVASVAANNRPHFFVAANTQPLNLSLFQCDLPSSVYVEGSGLVAVAHPPCTEEDNVHK